MIISPSAHAAQPPAQNAAIGSVLALLAASLPANGVALLANAIGEGRIAVADTSGDRGLVGQEMRVPAGLLGPAPILMQTGGTRIPLAWTVACGDRPSWMMAVPIPGYPLHLVVAWCGDVATDIDRTASAAAVIAQLFAAGQRTRAQADTSDRINSLVRHLPVPLVFVDSQGLQVFINNEAGALLGLRKEETEPRSITAALARLVNREGSGGLQGELTADRRARLGFEIARGEQTFKIESRWIDDGILSGRIWIFADVTEAKSAQAQLARLASEDALTGVLNRRSFELAFAAEIQHARRINRPLSVLVLDLDHFKRINDTYGHQAGDMVLREASAVAGRSLRQDDVLARIGGEEFAVLLPGTTIADAVEVAQRLRGAIRTAAFVHGEARLAVTCSIGAATYKPPVDGAEAMIGRADAALYTAKREGRDRVVAADEA